MSGFTVVYDANVLYPSILRDVLIRLANTGIFQARWTDTILDEVFDNLQKIGLTLIRTDLPEPEHSCARRSMIAS